MNWNWIPTSLGTATNPQAQQNASGTSITSYPYVPSAPTPAVITFPQYSTFSVQRLSPFHMFPSEVEAFKAQVAGCDGYQSHEEANANTEFWVIVVKYKDGNSLTYRVVEPKVL